MYKSHESGAMIGFSEAEITLAEGEAVVLRYAPPMIITQPGHITVSDFVSYDKIEQEVNASAQVMAQEKRANDAKIQQQEETMKKNYWIWVFLICLIPVLCGLIYALSWMMIVI